MAFTPASCGLGFTVIVSNEFFGICPLQVVTVEEAKALLKEDDDLIIAVYDYWLNKRLRTVSMQKLLNQLTGR